MKKTPIFVIAFVVLAGGALAAPRVLDHMERRQAMQEQEDLQDALPPPVVRNSSSRAAVSLSATVSSVAPKPMGNGVNLAVPFVPQAPLLNWDALHKEACEEAAIQMAIDYFAGVGTRSPEDADRVIIALANRVEEMGLAIDITAEQAKDVLLDQASHLTVKVLENPTKEDIMRALDVGSVLVVPAAGRELGNPYFQNPGPLYHMYVIRGYTADHVITNDPGTRRGEAFVYSWQTVLDSNHDWNGGDVANGERVMLVVSE